jgi:hypothetical protein
MWQMLGILSRTRKPERKLVEEERNHGKQKGTGRFSSWIYSLTTMDWVEEQRTAPLKEKIYAKKINKKMNLAAFYFCTIPKNYKKKNYS